MPEGGRAARALFSPFIAILSSPRLAKFYSAHRRRRRRDLWKFSTAVLFVYPCDGRWRRSLLIQFRGFPADAVVKRKQHPLGFACFRFFFLRSLGTLLSRLGERLFRIKNASTY